MRVSDWMTDGCSSAPARLRPPHPRRASCGQLALRDPCVRHALATVWGSRGGVNDAVPVAVSTRLRRLVIMASTDDRLTELEARVAALEGRSPAAPVEPVVDPEV